MITVHIVPTACRAGIPRKTAAFMQANRWHAGAFLTGNKLDFGMVSVHRAMLPHFQPQPFHTRVKVNA